VLALGLEVLVERAVGTGTRVEADPALLSAGMAHRAITERILEIVDEAGYKAALIDAVAGTVTAWPRFAQIVRAAADGLSRRGLAEGDMAGVFVQDAASFAIAVNAIRAAGAIASPIRPDASMAEVAVALNACGARLLITSAPLAEVAAEAADRSRVRQVFAFGEACGTTPFRSLFGETKHGETKHGATKHGAAATHEAGTPSLDEDHDCRPHLHGLSHRDVVVAGPPCGDGQAYTSLLDLTLLTGATIVAAPVPLIEAAMRTYKGTAAIVPRDAHVGGLAPGRVFAVA
jgi:acyl-CoA synthetase (AMP-forming)/AMP-acid ligase II